MGTSCGCRAILAVLRLATPGAPRLSLPAESILPPSTIDDIVCPRFLALGANAAAFLGQRSAVTAMQAMHADPTFRHRMD